MSENNRIVLNDLLPSNLISEIDIDNEKEYEENQEEIVDVNKIFEFKFFRI